MPSQLTISELIERLPAGVALQLLKTRNGWQGSISYETEVRDYPGSVSEKTTVKMDSQEDPRKMLPTLVWQLGKRLWPELINTMNGEAPPISQRAK